MKTNSDKKILSVILTILMIIGSFSVMTFAANQTFIYIDAPDGSDGIYVINCTSAAIINGNLIIPAEIDGKSVTGINEGAFWGDLSITKVTVPSSVTYIGTKAFAGCTNIESITIKNPDCDICAGVFSDTLWWKNQSSEYIFLGTTLLSYTGSDKTVYIPYNTEKIGSNAFANNTTVEKIILASETKEIGTKAFYNCENLDSIEIPDTCHIEKVGSFAFDNTKWLNDYNDDFVIIGTTLVRYKGTDMEVRIPNSITAVGEYAFVTNSNTVASRIFVPYSVKDFSKNCFELDTKGDILHPYLYVYKNSPAEKYAEDTDYGDYEILAIPGDVTNDGKVSANDARKILRTCAKLENSFSVSAMYGADIDNDGKVSVSDAREALRMAAKISSFTSEDYLNMPKTDYEVLSKVTSLLTQAQTLAGFDYYAYQNVTDTDMNLIARNHISVLNDNLTTEKNAMAETFTAGTTESASKILVSTLKNTKLIKSCTCKYTDGNYVINIILNDETVSSANSTDGETAKMFPVETVSEMKDILSQKKWYDITDPSFDFTVTYTDCAISITADIKTGEIDSLSYTMNYKIAFSGSINGIKIRSTNGNENASITRHDMTTYQNINYPDLLK